MRRKTSTVRGRKGGLARMASMTAKQRSSFGRKGAKARWALVAKSAKMNAHAEKVRKEADRIGPFLPEISRHDLLLILDRRLRPWGSGQRFFIRRNPDDVGYVF